MKKIFTLFFVTFFIGATFAQDATSAELSACKLGTSGVRITYDASLNCNPAGPFAGINTLGVHSGGGATPWASVTDWNAATAIQATRVGTTNDFVVDIADVNTYYNTTGVEQIGLVFNQGPVDANAPWDKKGEGLKSDNTCGDLFVIGVSALPACTSNNNDISVVLGMSIAPNPSNGNAVLTFNNADGNVYDMTISTLVGQTVSTQKNIKTNTVNIEKGNMTAGMYFVTLRNTQGKFATEKLVIE